MTQEQAVEEIKKQAAASGAKFISTHESPNWGPAFGPQGTKTIYLTYELTNPKNPRDVRQMVFSAGWDGKVTRAQK